MVKYVRSKDKKLKESKMAIIKESLEKTDYKLLDKVPNAETIESIENIENGIGLHEVASVDELFKELRS